MKLHFGVIDIPYAEPPEVTKKLKKRKAKQSGVRITTGEVADILEAKYEVMGHFADQFQTVIAMHLEQSISGAIENMMLGAPPIEDPFQEATNEIEIDFTKFIDTAEIEKLGLPGIPTQAAIDGVQTRLKDKKGARRVSFRDTGMYVGNFKAWMED